MGPGTGNWGLFEAEDAEVAQALLAAAEGWLTAQGMTRSLGPLSISIWDEPGLLVEGFDTPPTIMLGHNSPQIGRPSCRARVCQYVEISVVAVSLKKNKKKIKS